LFPIIAGACSTLAPRASATSNLNNDYEIASLSSAMVRHTPHGVRESKIGGSHDGCAVGDFS
jgi:hypothetical protein